jgi:hypothetical protein
MNMTDTEDDAMEDSPSALIISGVTVENSLDCEIFQYTDAEGSSVIRTESMKHIKVYLTKDERDECYTICVENAEKDMFERFIASSWRLVSKYWDRLFDKKVEVEDDEELFEVEINHAVFWTHPVKITCPNLLPRVTYSATHPDIVDTIYFTHLRS